MIMAKLISRRRMILVSAAACGLPLVDRTMAHAEAKPVIWKGQALGAVATLVLNHPDRAKAEQLIGQVVKEVARLEAIFSLYRPESELSQLNRLGALAMPSEELVALLEASRLVWQDTDGLFDPTIQPLWTLHARHFAQPDADATGPSAAQIKRARSLVGFEKVSFNRDRVAFAKPDMGLTLNGIAQGYIADRIVSLLREAGITSSLVDMGEISAIGRRDDGTAWQVGLADTPEGFTAGDMVIPLVDKALATSSPYGFRFDSAAQFGHIFHPRKAVTTPLCRRLTAICDNATTADAYSTAMTLMEPDEIRAVIAKRAGLSVDLITAAGEHVRLG